jgi:hypothetical protein
MTQAPLDGWPAPRIGVYGTVTGVRAGRPIGVQAIDLLGTQLPPADAARALSRALSSLGVQVPVPEPELL